MGDAQERFGITFSEIKKGHTRKFKDAVISFLQSTGIAAEQILSYGTTKRRIVVGYLTDLQRRSIELLLSSKELHRVEPKGNTPVTPSPPSHSSPSSTHPS